MKTLEKGGIAVTKRMTTETAHRLTNYEGKCASIHGHSYLWEVTVGLDGLGVTNNCISVDFKDVKKAMKACIYDLFDHALVLHKNDFLVVDHGLLLQVDAAGLKQKLVVFGENPTAEAFAAYVSGSLQDYFDDLVAALEVVADIDINVLRVRVWETADSYAEWNKRN